MFGLNDNSNKSADGGGLPPNDQASMPNPFSDNAAGTPPAGPSASPEPAMPAPPPAADMPKTTSTPAGSSDLIGLKEQAISSLQPLVGQLDQSPEEKFKTTMMLIQATDNPSLVKQAYEAANQITDEKARAQALLDVVNEINYFTQRDKNAEAKA